MKYEYMRNTKEIFGACSEVMRKTQQPLSKNMYISLKSHNTPEGKGHGTIDKEKTKGTVTLGRPEENFTGKHVG